MKTMITDEIQQLKNEIQEIKQRNVRVERDKAWETSLARKILITLLTYSVVVLFFFFAHLPKPFVNAIVPTIGYILSTFSLPIFKKLWIRRMRKKT
jgi:preprotein translocase subunit SecF